MMTALMKAMEIQPTPTQGMPPRMERRSIDKEGEQFAVGDSDDELTT